MKQNNNLIEQYRLTLAVAQAKGKNQTMATTSADGNNGLFLVPFKKRVTLICIVSDGAGWEHVSVTVHRKHRTPTWDEMHYVKELFWTDEETVIQYHPRRRDYVNNHNFCLHMWRPTAQYLPTPPPILVGIK